MAARPLGSNPRPSAIKENTVEVDDDVMFFLRAFNNVDPRTLDDILEWLYDKEMLDHYGVTFRSRFWETFIKDDKKTDDKSNGSC